MSSIAISSSIEPLKSELLDALGGCGIVHSACHGIAYSEDASSGSLFLWANTNEAPERLMLQELAGFRHSLAQIAYLSACPTAENSSISLANEVIHIAAFQLLARTLLEHCARPPISVQERSQERSMGTW
jgi:hypothetical protein